MRKVAREMKINREISDLMARVELFLCPYKNERGSEANSREQTHKTSKV